MNHCYCILLSYGTTMRGHRTTMSDLKSLVVCESHSSCGSYDNLLSSSQGTTHSTHDCNSETTAPITTTPTPAPTTKTTTITTRTIYNCFFDCISASYFDRKKSMKPFMSFTIVSEMISNPAGACDG